MHCYDTRIPSLLLVCGPSTASLQLRLLRALHPSSRANGVLTAHAPRWYQGNYHQLIRCCARGGEEWKGWACEADVLIIDATNVACIAAAEQRALHAVGATLPAQFAAWLAFLQLAVRAPHAIAVFDDRRVCSG